MCRLALIVILTAIAVSAQTGFSISDILSAPFSEELTPAPAANRFAWIANSRGLRNIWAAEAPSSRARQLTQYKDDDGQEIGELVWTPDAAAIVYTRSGDLSMRREVPNPTGYFDRPVQSIWKIAYAGGVPIRIGEGHSPAISAKGSLAYVKANEVWRDGKKWFTTRGGISQLTWSPDGARLACVVSRGDHAFIAVTSNDHLNFLDPSVDSDTSPVWSPDGRSIAFVRIAASTRAFQFGPVRTAHPWAIHIADPSNGKSRRIFRADEGPGSAFHPVVADRQLFWAANNRLFFPWEKSGWTQLYSVPTTTPGSAQLHTPGEFEVEHVSLSPDASTIHFSSNQNDIDRRHAWKLPVGAATPEPVTSGTNIEWSPAALSDNKTVVCLKSTPRLPAHPSAIAGDVAKDLALDAIPDNFPTQPIEPKQVIFAAADGTPIHGQLWVPPNPQDQKLPAVVFFHGGSRRQMLLGRHYLYYYSGTYAFNQYLANIGYVVLSVNYRSGTGYGLNFREAENYGATGASEFNDVLGAGLYLRSHPQVDPKRIGVWGGSYGGYLTAMALSRASDLFACGVDIHGVHDWNNVIRNFVPAYNPQSQPEAARLAFESSPLASIKTWRSPVLLIHGDDDRNVPFNETVRLAEALRQHRVPFEQLIFPDDVHDFLTHAHWIEAYSAAADFFNRHLKR